MTDDEFDEMLEELAAVHRPRMANRPHGTRRRRLISTVNVPGE